MAKKKIVLTQHPVGATGHPLRKLKTKERAHAAESRQRSLASGQERGTDANLVPGKGRKPREILTEAEMTFCASYVMTGNARLSSLYAGFSECWGYALLRRAKIQSLVKEFQSRKIEECWNSTKDQVSLAREFLDAQTIKRLVSMKTHPKVGDLPFVRLIETGYKAIGAIQPAKMVQQQSQQQAQVATNAFQVYEAKWLRDKKAQWDQQLLAKHNMEGV